MPNLNDIPAIAQARLAVQGFWAAWRAVIVGGAFVLLALALVVQTVRIEGFAVWPLSIEGYRAEVERLRGDLARVEAGQALAAEAQTQVNQQAEDDLRHKAKGVDDDATQSMDAERDRTEQFIARGGVAVGVRGQAVDCPSGGAGAAAQNHRAGHPESAGGTAQLDAAAPNAPAVAAGLNGGLTQTVAVLAQDVRICTTNTIKAEAAHDWALSLESAGK